MKSYNSPTKSTGSKAKAMPEKNMGKGGGINKSDPGASRADSTATVTHSNPYPKGMS